MVHLYKENQIQKHNVKKLAKQVNLGFIEKSRYIRLCAYYFNTFPVGSGYVNKECGNNNW